MIVVLAVLLVALAVVYVVSAVHRPSQRSTPGFVARVNDYTAPAAVEQIRGSDGDVIGWTRKDAA